MKIEKTACDHCSKETFDLRDEIGWISIENGNVTVVLGRGKERQARSAWMQKASWDFCCIQCLVSWMTQLAANAAIKSKTPISCWSGALIVECGEGNSDAKP